MLRGGRADARMDFVGVNIFQVRDDQLWRGRIYTELVRQAGGLERQADRMTRGVR